jgi:hypothetical protein
MRSLHNKGGYMRRIACSHFDVAARIKKREDTQMEQHAIFEHVLQRALGLMLRFSNIYCAL